VHYLSIVCYNKIIVIASIIVVLIIPLVLSHAHQSHHWRASHYASKFLTN